jgi:hypothetical protein
MLLLDDDHNADDVPGMADGLVMLNCTDGTKAISKTSRAYYTLIDTASRAIAATVKFG